MEIKFDFDMEDWMEFQKHFLDNSKQINKTKNILLYGFPIIWILLFLLFLYGGSFKVELLVISILWIVIYNYVFKKRVLRKTKQIIEEGNNEGILGVHHITFNQEEIIHKTSNSEMKINWSGILKFEETNNYYFLFNTSVSAIIIPKFKLKNELSEIDKILKEHFA